jgi:PKD repeat protein
VCTVPAARFTSSRVTDKTIEFSDRSSAPAGCPITTWFWQFGDGQISNAVNPVHSYQSGNQRDVTLTVTNSVGAHSVILRVDP